MPIIIVIVAVILIIVLVKFDVPSTIIAIAVPLIFSTLGGVATAGIVSLIATPIVGLPVGFMVATYIFSKLVRSRN